MIGHRGYMSRYPENTHLGFRKAFEVGADGIEFDVRITKDGELVIVHDSTLERTAGLRKAVREASMTEIWAADVGLGERVPTLRGVLSELPRGKLVNVEIKDVDATEPAVRLIQELNLVNRTLLSSFKVESLWIGRSLDPGLRLGLLIEEEDVVRKVPNLTRELRLYSVNVPMEAIQLVGFEKFREALAAGKKLGLRIALWTLDESLFYENNNLMRLRGLFDIVVTNDVGSMINYLRAAGVR